jgi:hypothetical protein
MRAARWWEKWSPQVGITKINELTGDDSDTFERISQAINSAEELVVEAL